MAVTLESILTQTFEMLDKFIEFTKVYTPHYLNKSNYFLLSSHTYIYSSGYTTYHLVHVLRESRKKRKGMTTKSREDVTQSLVIVVITYIVCQLPNPCRAFFYVTNQNLECGSVYHVFEPWAFNAAMFNSAVNFVILVFCGKRFRLKFKATVCFRRVKVGPESLNTVVNHNSERTGNVLMMDTSTHHV